MGGGRLHQDPARTAVRQEESRHQTVCGFRWTSTPTSGISPTGYDEAAGIGNGKAIGMQLISQTRVQYGGMTLNTRQSTNTA